LADSLKFSMRPLINTR